MYHYRLAKYSDDYESIIQLQSINLKHNIDHRNNKNGYLSVEFSLYDFKKMNQDAAVIVCEHHGKIIRYRASSNIEFNRKFTLPNIMINQMPYLSYKGKSLQEYTAIIPGPTCVSIEYRRKGIGSELRNVLQDYLPNCYDLFITFVSQNNHISLSNNLKNGLEQVGLFYHNNEAFIILAKKI